MSSPVKEELRLVTSFGWRPQFSLRVMLCVTCVVASWFGLLHNWPHVAVFVLGMALPAIFAVSLVRFRKRMELSATGMFPNCVHTALYWLTAVSFIVYYVVSIGPVIAVAEYVGISPGNNFFEYVYAPVIWLHDHTPLAKPLEAYAHGWGWH